MNISNHKKTILLIIVTLIVFFGYWFFFLSKKDTSIKNTNNGLVNTTTGSPVASNTQYDKDFVASLLGLNSVNIDVALFNLKTYQALSYPEVPFAVNYFRESGRDNPFLPIGVNPSSNSSVQNQVNITSPDSNQNTSTTTNISTPVSTTTTPTSTTTNNPKPTPKKF